MNQMNAGDINAAGRVANSPVAGDNIGRDSLLHRPCPLESPMVITAAHIPAIVALIAGILILVMPRLLNFIVAIYLIFIGLVGLGVLHALHL
jgi:hypothetical protein